MTTRVVLPFETTLNVTQYFGVAPYIPSPKWCNFYSSVGVDFYTNLVKYICIIGLEMVFVIAILPDIHLYLLFCIVPGYGIMRKPPC